MAPERSVSRFLRSRFAPFTFIASTVAFAIWTWIALGTTWLTGLDDLSRTHRLTPGSPAAQVWAAISIVTLPGVLATGMLLVSMWAWRRRLRNLAWALVLSTALAWGGNHVLKAVFARPRPSSPMDDIITHSGWAYPSGHVAMATSCVVMVIATTTTTRQTADVRYMSRVLGVLGVAVVGYDRFILNAHWTTDIVGGFLFGLVCASLACWACRVHMVPVPARSDSRPGRRTCAIIWNPSKVVDRSSFHRSLEWELDAHGWNDPLWLQTRPDDAGREMTRTAIEMGVDLVLVAGGDGTVRVVCSELANTGIPVGIIPAGTGNLLARNLGIPLDEVAAARVAFGGHARPIDLVKVTVDDDPSTSEHFAVMGGLGYDAQIMEATRPELKRTVGSAAYFVAAASQVGMPAMDLAFQIDDGPVEKRHAKIALIGNVGLLQANIQLFPKASATDGLLDVIVASPTGVADMATMAARLFARLRGEVAHVDEVSGHRIRITVAEPVPYELDGDPEGRARVFEAEVAPGALLLMQR